MGKKRPSGDGMIRKRADGRWEGRVVAGHTSTGKPIARVVYAKTQKELLIKLHQSIETYRDVELTEDCRMTLSAWLDRWLDEYMAGTIRDNTLKEYRNDLKNYILPYLGDKPMYQITSIDVQKVYLKLKESGRVKKDDGGEPGLSNTSLSHIHSLLHNAMKAAVKAHLIPKNPTEGATAPRPDYKPKQILDDEQLDRFMAEVAKDPFWYDFFYTEMTTGLRRGEICGLIWSDFASAEGILSVRRTLYTANKDGIRFGEAKTETGMRDIVLPYSTVKLLNKRKESALTEWIFPNPLHPEYPVPTSTAYCRMKEFLKSADLPCIRFHDLRHTFATHALASGVDAKTLASILGHTNASFTLDTYTHVTTDMQRRASVVVESFISDFVEENVLSCQDDEKMELALSQNEKMGDGKDA